MPSLLSPLLPKFPSFDSPRKRKRANSSTRPVSFYPSLAFPYQSADEQRLDNAVYGQTFLPPPTPPQDVVDRINSQIRSNPTLGCPANFDFGAHVRSRSYVMSSFCCLGPNASVDGRFHRSDDDLQHLFQGAAFLDQSVVNLLPPVFSTTSVSSALYASSVCTPKKSKHASPRRLSRSVAAVPKPPSFEIKDASSAKGVGMFASHDLVANDVILIEHPVLVVPFLIGLATPLGELYRALVELLPEDKKKAVMQLANCRSLANDGVCNEAGGADIEGIIRTNAIGISLDVPEDVQSPELDIHRAVFLNTSRCNHSCSPNAKWSWDVDTFSLTLRAVRTIPAGEEITIQYIHALQSRDERRALLKELYDFTCRCRACDPPVATPPVSYGIYASSSSSRSSTSASSSHAQSHKRTRSDTSAFTSKSGGTSQENGYGHSRISSLTSFSPTSSASSRSSLSWSSKPASWSSRDSLDGRITAVPLYRQPDSRERRTQLIRESDESRAFLATFSHSHLSFETWVLDSSSPPYLLIDAHLRALQIIDAEGLEVLEDEIGRHLDGLAMCYGALGEVEQFREWVGRVRAWRSMVSLSADGDRGSDDGHSSSGSMASRGDDDHRKKRDVVFAKWLSNPMTFPAWGWRKTFCGSRGSVELVAC